MKIEGANSYERTFEDWRKLIRTPSQSKKLSLEAKRRVRMAAAEKARQIAGENFLAFAARQSHFNATT